MKLIQKIIIKKNQILKIAKDNFINNNINQSPVITVIIPITIILKN